ncbi:MAG TPA: TerB family tellurite resistance protein [Polyangiales bacterium]|nr:TerB family tellurite resistance protein [Polyangiales bacterium]
MFFKRVMKPAAPSTGTDVLREVVQTEMKGADPESARIVVAVAGLLASVAHADRRYTAQEKAYMHDALQRLDGLTAEGADAVCAVIEKQGVTIGAHNPHAFTRELRDRTDVELRREVLEVLVDLAAADGELSLSETDLLRRTCSALGLTPQDYLNAQARHREKLSTLK